jgi:hypothetical protein
MESQFLSTCFGACIGASVAELATLPICTVKTFYQSRNSISYSEAIKEIYKKNGILGFYRASLPAISAQIFTSAYKITVFNYLRSRLPLDKSQNIFYIMFIGLISSVTCLLFTHPLDYFRVSMQVMNKIQIKDIYKGISPALMKSALGGILYLPLRQNLKNSYPNQESWKIGLISAIISTIVVHPFDFLKTFIMANKKYVNLPFRNLYRGLPINLCRIVPHFVIMTEISEKFETK